jgi:hypothetical protein
MIGVFHNYLAASLVPDVDPEFVLRAWQWYQKVIATDNRFGGGSFVLLEIMQKVSAYEYVFHLFPIEGLTKSTDSFRIYPVAGYHSLAAHLFSAHSTAPYRLHGWIGSI